MASRLQQLIIPEIKEIPEIPTKVSIRGGSRLGLLKEPEIGLGRKIALGLEEIPEPPKAIQKFPSTMNMLAELQIDPFSLKENPKEAVGSAWDSLKTSVSQSASRIYKQFTEHQTIGEQLKGVAAIGHLAFAPISAFFEGANKIPVLGSISRLISLPFVAAGEGGAKLSGDIVDKLPIPDEQIDLETGETKYPKQDIKEGVQEIVSLAAQLAVGKITHIATKKYGKLKERFGEKDADVIVEKAGELAERAKEPMPTEIVKPEVPIEKVKPEITEIVKPKRKYAEVSRGRLPVKEGVEKGVSGLEARMKGFLETEDVKLAKKEAKERGLDISVYDRMSKPEQMRKAAEYVEKTPQYEALEVLKGEREAPKGLLENAIMLALEQKSLRDKNVNLAMKLASLRSTRMGQEISILTEVEGTSPVSGLNEIIRARRDVATKKLRAGETLKTRRTSSVKEIKTEQTKFQLKVSEVERILNEIIC